MCESLSKDKNVLGQPLRGCCQEPMTGYFRDGFCRTDATDKGSHTVCARVTASFLEFSKSHGNDLSTPRLEFRFPGLKPGDQWCLCARRWQQAFEHGCAPPVILAACHERCLEIVALADLKEYALDLES